MTAECLYCGEDVYVGRNPQVGNFITCDGCDSQFEIIDLEPIMVDWPYYEDDYIQELDLYKTSMMNRIIDLEDTFPRKKAKPLSRRTGNPSVATRHFKKSTK